MELEHLCRFLRLVSLLFVCNLFYFPWRGKKGGGGYTESLGTLVPTEEGEFNSAQLQVCMFFKSPDDLNPNV